MGFKFEASGEEGILKVDGEISILCAGEFKNALTNSLERSNCLMLDLEAVSGMDVSCLQLICSAHRKAVLSEKQLILRGRLSDACRQIVKDSGYAREKGCMPDQDKPCLWAKGGV